MNWRMFSDVKKMILTNRFVESSENGWKQQILSSLGSE